MLRSYLEMVGYLLKMFAADQTIAKCDASITGYMHSLSITSLQHADDIIAKSGSVEHVYDEGMLLAVFNKGVDSPIRHSLRRL